MPDQLQNIVKTVTFNAPIEKVWESVTNAEKLGSWFMPNDFKAIEGHAFTLQSPFGPSLCKVEKVDAPYYIRFAWDTDGWFVTFELKQIGEQTAFTLTHGGWKEASHIIPKANMPAQAVYQNMDSGWSKLVSNKLKEVVESI